MQPIWRAAKTVAFWTAFVLCTVLAFGFIFGGLLFSAWAPPR